jgi:hypothetical protein
VPAARAAREERAEQEALPSRRWAEQGRTCIGRTGAQAVQAELSAHAALLSMWRVYNVFLSSDCLAAGFNSLFRLLDWLQGSQSHTLPTTLQPLLEQKQMENIQTNIHKHQTTVSVAKEVTKEKDPTK